MSVAVAQAVSSVLRPEYLSTQPVVIHPILAKARERAVAERLAYAGSVATEDAWELFSSGEARIVDVRTAEELKFVGHVQDSLHVAWQSGPKMERNPRFVEELAALVGKDEPVLLLCRSGKRSVAAATAAKQAGFTQVFNILEGFEGDLNGSSQRGGKNGWRQRGLPWEQD